MSLVPVQAVPAALLSAARRENYRALPCAMPTMFRSQIRYDDPLNLSILLSGGKETNKDSLSKGD